MDRTKEVVIGYNSHDLEFVKRLAASFRAAGLNVWYLTGQHSALEAGNIKSQAIMSCCIYVPVLSENSAVDPTIKDELALAYISNSVIFPLGTLKHRSLAPKISGGMKLILAKINWCFVLKPEHYDQNIPNMIESMKKELQRLREGTGTGGPMKTSSVVYTHGMTFNAHMTHGLSMHVPMDEGAEGDGQKGADFWDRHFVNRSEVPWLDFKEKFLEDYGNQITEDYSRKKKSAFVQMIRRDVFNVGYKTEVSRADYDNFCGENTKQDPNFFYSQLQEYAVAYLSLESVFDMKSSLRISTIQNLGNFTFPAIIQGLAKLLEDYDPNIRAVAAIALAKSGKDAEETVALLVKMLEDEDRLVRESVCLSLGYLQATSAVHHVVERWRNDPISTVREAAELALRRMNIEEAQRCIQVTKVLQEEMHGLKPKT